ncbi:MAG: type II secretion system F family protein, partial [Spirochaetota bacterium]
LPFVGTLIVYREMVALATAIGALVSTGAPLERAVGIAAGCVRNRRVRMALERGRERIAFGEPLTDALAELPGFDLARRWLALPDAGANLPESLAGLAALAERRLQEALLRLASLIEPALTLVAGCVVLALVLTIVRPLIAWPAGALP